MNRKHKSKNKQNKSTNAAVSQKSAEIELKVESEQKNEEIISDIKVKSEEKNEERLPEIKPGITSEIVIENKSEIEEESPKKPKRSRGKKKNEKALEVETEEQNMTKNMDNPNVIETTEIIENKIEINSEQCEISPTASRKKKNKNKKNMEKAGEEIVETEKLVPVTSLIQTSTLENIEQSDQNVEQNVSNVIVDEPSNIKKKNKNKKNKQNKLDNDKLDIKSMIVKEESKQEIIETDLSKNENTESKTFKLEYKEENLQGVKAIKSEIGEAFNEPLELFIEEKSKSKKKNKKKRTESELSEKDIMMNKERTEQQTSTEIISKCGHQVTDIKLSKQDSDKKTKTLQPINTISEIKKIEMKEQLTKDDNQSKININIENIEKQNKVCCDNKQPERIILKPNICRDQDLKTHEQSSNVDKNGTTPIITPEKKADNQTQSIKDDNILVEIQKNKKKNKKSRIDSEKSESRSETTPKSGNISESTIVGSESHEHISLISSNTCEEKDLSLKSTTSIQPLNIQRELKQNVEPIICKETKNHNMDVSTTIKKEAQNNPHAENNQKCKRKKQKLLTDPCKYESRKEVKTDIDKITDFVSDAKILSIQNAESKQTSSISGNDLDSESDFSQISLKDITKPNIDITTDRNENVESIGNTQKVKIDSEVSTETDNYKKASKEDLDKSKKNTKKDETQFKDKLQKSQTDVAVENKEKNEESCSREKNTDTQSDSKFLETGIQVLDNFSLNNESLPDSIEHPRSLSEEISTDTNNNMVIQELVTPEIQTLNIPLIIPDTPFIKGSTPLLTPIDLESTVINIPNIESKFTCSSETTSEKTDLKSKVMEVNQDMEELRLSIEKSLAELTSLEKCEEMPELLPPYPKIQSDTNKMNKTVSVNDDSMGNPSVDVASNTKIHEQCSTTKKSLPVASDIDLINDNILKDSSSKAPICPARKDKGKGKSKNKSNSAISNTLVVASCDQSSSTSTSNTATNIKEDTNGKNEVESQTQQKQNQSESNKKQTDNTEGNNQKDFDQTQENNNKNEPTESFEDAMTFSVDDVNKSFELISTEVITSANIEENVNSAIVNEAADEKKIDEKQNPLVSHPKNLLGHPVIPVQSSKTDYKKEKNKTPNMKQAKVRIKDIVDVEHIDQNCKQSKESQTENKAKTTKKILEKIYPYSNEDYVYKYSFRKVFLPHSCHVCKKDLRNVRIPCNYCNLLFYCSTKHKDEDRPQHESLCFAISTILHLKGTVIFKIINKKYILNFVLYFIEFHCVICIYR